MRHSDHFDGVFAVPKSENPGGDPGFEFAGIARFKRAQLPAVRELSTVCARRFWDQQEMSLQTATGRSLP